MYDTVIIGSGIAGLYSAYLITKTDPNQSIVILEKYSKPYIGGRANNEMFQGVSVVTGAGVVRKEKDTLLVDLIKTLHIPAHEFTSEHHYARTIQSDCHVKRDFLEIKRAYLQSDPRPKKTFKEFGISVLGKDRYKQFVICSGYTDYENEDVYSTLHMYGFDDNFSSWTAMGISWHMLIEKMVGIIGEKNIHCKKNVIHIHCIQPFDYSIDIENSASIKAKKVIVATTIDTVMKIVPGASTRDSLYRNIQGQPFLRLYGKFNKASTEMMNQHVLSGMTMVPGPLQKIIPMNKEKGVYMIAYSDNASATKLKPILENTPEHRDHFCRLIEKALGLEEGILTMTAITHFYWPIGTHYYTPLDKRFKTRNEFIKKAQHPLPGLLVVGEMISSNQGWVEGALESVNKVVTPSWIRIKQ